MSKRKQLENLAVFIGLRAAHEILVKITGKPESIPHLESEVDTYNDLCFELVQGNWNYGDLARIKELAIKKCIKKLRSYEDLGDYKYSGVEKIIEDIMLDLGLI